MKLIGLVNVDKSKLSRNTAEFGALAFSDADMILIVCVHVLEVSDVFGEEVADAVSTEEGKLFVLLDEILCVDGNTGHLTVLIDDLVVEVAVNSVIRNSVNDRSSVGSTRNFDVDLLTFLNVLSEVTFECVFYDLEHSFGSS